MKLELRNFTPILIGRMAAGMPTYVSRWNDGEWLSVLGKRGRNCDGARFERARMALRAVLSAKHNPSHLLCAGPPNYKRRYRKIDKWLADNAPHRLGGQWYDSFWTKSIVETGRLDKFLGLIRMYRCVLVGPPHLLAVAHHIQASFIECHPSDAIDQVRDLFQSVRHSGAEVALLCCGWSANVLVERISVTKSLKMALDIGSMFDPLAGVPSRGCWRKYLKIGIMESIHAA